MDLLNVKYISEGVPRGGGQQIPKLYFGEKKADILLFTKVNEFFFQNYSFCFIITF